ncbi:hypothetical protein DPMN_170174 [Dreissena polymorpha]|uniref:Uncharacterized protein n=1 Tax=Dreissena polymorpha TaxID=45954 RepID=A0A9D4IE18_DREPO|nr:hypothetical protein DPMN_170174 [Dreissena polymorpha]
MRLSSKKTVLRCLCGWSSKFQPQQNSPGRAFTFRQRPAFRGLTRPSRRQRFAALLYHHKCQCH